MFDPCSLFFALLTFLWQRWVDALLVLYHEGPTFYGYGFWGGASRSDICFSMTGVDAAFWDANPAACDEMFFKRFRSFELSVCWICCTLLAYQLYNWVQFYFFVTRPFLSAATRLVHVHTKANRIPETSTTPLRSLLYE